MSVCLPNRPLLTAHEDLHDIGILLVHGIGEQKQGETLTQCGVPVIEWMREWLAPQVTRDKSGKETRHKGLTGRVRPLETVLRAPQLYRDEPAHTLIEVTLDCDSAEAASSPAVNRSPVTSQQWLFAECWWSSQAIAPRIGPFLLWLVTRGPWVILLHLNQRAFARPHSPALKGVTFMLVLVAWLLLSLCLSLIWSVVALIALVPVGRLRQSVYRTLQRLAGVVGDAYVLVDDPFQRSSFETATIRSLRWLAARCKKIAVVAHSQGSAVVHQALLVRDSPQVELLITYGAGLAKLRALRTARANFPKSFAAAGLAAPLAAMAAVWAVRLRMLGAPEVFYQLGPGLLGFIAAGLFLRTWSTVETVRRWLRENSKVLQFDETQASLRWHDFYSTHDPVPNGPLWSSIVLPAVRSQCVSVLGSRVADHTNYWSSRADFVPRVVARLAHCSGLPLMHSPPRLGRLRRARRRFSHRVWALRVLRWSDVCALLLPVSLAPAHVTAVGAALRVALAGTGLGKAEDILSGLAAIPLRIAAALLGAPLADEAASIDFTSMLILLAAVLFVWKKIFFEIWRWWADLPLEHVFTPGDVFESDDKMDRFFLAAGIATLGLVPLMVSVSWTFFPGSIAESNVYGAFVTAVASALMIMLLLIVLFALYEAGRLIFSKILKHRLPQ